MWHVLVADPERTHLRPASGASPDAFLRRPGRKSEALLLLSPAVARPRSLRWAPHAYRRHPLAEIPEQRSTYRIHDWTRADRQGRPPEPHLDKAARVTNPGASHGGAARPLTCEGPDGPVTLLGACRYFASALLPVSGSRRHSTGGHSFHVILPCDGPMEISAGDETISLARCQAA